MVRFYTGLIFAFVGAIFCTVSLVMYISTRNFLQGTMASQGRITSCQMQPVTNSDQSVSYLCQPTVHFTTASGQEVDFVSSFSANTFHEGDEVPSLFADWYKLSDGCIIKKDGSSVCP